MHLSQHKLYTGKMELALKVKFISTSTELHANGDERWPMEVTSNSYFRGVVRRTVGSMYKSRNSDKLTILSVLKQSRTKRGRRKSMTNVPCSPCSSSCSSRACAVALEPGATCSTGRLPRSCARNQSQCTLYLWQANEKNHAQETVLARTLLIGCLWFVALCWTKSGPSNRPWMFLGFGFIAAVWTYQLCWGYRVHPTKMWLRFQGSRLRPT